MTSVQVDAEALRTAAGQLDMAARDLSSAHGQAGAALEVDVPRLQGGAALQARTMLQEALAACVRLGDSNSRLADALSQATGGTEQLEAALVACFSPRK